MADTSQPTPRYNDDAAAPISTEQIGTATQTPVDDETEAGTTEPWFGEPDTAPDTAQVLRPEVAALATLTREPQQLHWADTGERVGDVTLQLVPPYERRISRTSRGDLVTGVRVACALDGERQLHVDLAAAQTRMASVWDDRDTAPIALLQYETIDRPTREQADPGHSGQVIVTTDVYAYFGRDDAPTTQYRNLETALVLLARALL